jgi:dienelactone hydrolase
MSARARWIGAVAAASVGLGLSALPGTSASAAAPVVVRGVTIPSFYTPPSTLPRANGALVRAQPLPLAFSLPGAAGPMPGRATRLMYRTTDSTGRAAPVTGSYFEPSAAWPGPGARPLVVLAPGTMGAGDQCATSLALERGLVAGDGTFSFGYEVMSIYGLLSKGIAVVQTDYVGLGATDRLHTYVNRIDSAHAVLDAARAVRSLTGTTVTRRSAVGLYGYSQGGGAVAAAAELQRTYAPDVALRATYAGAPPANLAKVTSAIDGSELVGALGWSINGFLQSSPKLRPLVGKYLTTAGSAVLKDLSTMCVGDAIGKYANQKSSAWTKGAIALSEIIRAEPQIRSFMAAQRIGKIRPTGIVRVATGVNDNLVPHGQARQLAVDWCRHGGKVVYAPVSTLKVDSPLINHAVPLLSDQQSAIQWITDRLAGQPAASGCASVPGQA